MSKGKLIVANLEGKYNWKPILKDSLAARIATITCEKPRLCRGKAMTILKKKIVIKRILKKQTKAI